VEEFETFNSFFYIRNGVYTLFLVHNTIKGTQLYTKQVLEGKCIPLKNKGFLTGKWFSRHFPGTVLPDWSDPTPMGIEPWYWAGCCCPQECLILVIRLTEVSRLPLLRSSLPLSLSILSKYILFGLSTGLIGNHKVKLTAACSKRLRAWKAKNIIAWIEGIWEQKPW